MMGVMCWLPGQFWTSCNINVRTMFSYNLKYYLPVSFSFPYKVSSIAFPYSTPGIQHVEKKKKCGDGNYYQRKLRRYLCTTKSPFLEAMSLMSQVPIVVLTKLKTGIFIQEKKEIERGKKKQRRKEREGGKKKKRRQNRQKEREEKKRRKKKKVTIKQEKRDDN